MYTLAQHFANISQTVIMGRYSKVVRGRPSGKPALMPEPVKIFMARRMIDGTAVAVLAAAAALVLALLSYSPADSSFNTAGGAPGRTTNWIGGPGAYVADLLWQTLGFGSFVFAIVLGVWAVRIARRQALSPLWLRVSMAIVAVLAIAAAFARIPLGRAAIGSQVWAGGSGGTLLLNLIDRPLVGLAGQGANSIAALLAFFAGLAALAIACVASWRGIAHGVAGLFTMVSRLFRTALRHASAGYRWIAHYGQKNAPAKPASPDEPTVGKDDAAEADDDRAETSRARAKLFKGMPGFPKTDDKAAPKVVNAKAAAPKPGARQSSFALANENEEWEFPSVELLQEVPAATADMKPDEGALQKNARMLQQVLSDFNVTGDVVSIHPGPVVTLYELEPAPGTKSSRVISLSDDIARSMSALSVRSAVVPGRNVIGIELPNKKRQTVYMRELLETDTMRNTKAALPLILGKDIGGAPIIADLAKMPHLLVAGTTGSGKSVAVNTMILSLLYHLPPDKCRFIMIDPKMLELSVYQDIPHLLSPVVTEPGKAVVSLKWAVAEMENRYRSMSRLGVRNIDGYNARLADARKKGETMMRKVQTGFDVETGKPVYEEQPMDMNALPYIVIIVDEFADLMLVAGKDVENAIQRLAQMARAAGIHLIMATQRPSVDVITGVIKANFPTRISFQVTSKIDSRTILNEMGAEQLLGMGDMLYMASGGQIRRVHGPFVSDEDVEQVVRHLKAQGEPAYLEAVTEGGDFGDSEVMGALFGDTGGGASDGPAVDDMYDQAVAIVARERKASTSFIQRHLMIGYNRAARIIEEMERQGVVTKANATGKREVLVGDYSEV